MPNNTIKSCIAGETKHGIFETTIRSKLSRDFWNIAVVIPKPLSGHITATPVMSELPAWDGQKRKSTSSISARGDLEPKLSVLAQAQIPAVAAAQDWDGNMNIMDLQARLPGSYEEFMHAAGIDLFVLDLRKGRCGERLREILNEKSLERFIGLLYKLETEKALHYSYAVLPEQSDGFIWFNKSKHVGTLEVHQPKSPREYHEIWPFGL
ncbi:erythromycin esterase [Fusarium agapanthi]|uniref:Erythromycin esterase n=1 Tax=Fusarium agapanthi TaxID=1803897 RepID=A0A9P5B2M9_9HYPO|nr:erythromycin esterase [Fusarium agapanthi]